MGKKNKFKNKPGPSDSGSQQSTSGNASGNKEKDAQNQQKQQTTSQGQQQEPKSQGQQQQPKAQGQQQQPKAQGQQQQPKEQGQQQQPKAQAQQKWTGSQQSNTQGQPQGQSQQSNTQAWQQQSRPQGQQQWPGSQQSSTQGRPQGQPQQSNTQAWQQQSRPQGQQQWPGSQQSNTQGRPQGQQQQSTTQGWQQQSRPQGQQQWPGSQQPGTQAWQQQSRPHGQQQRPASQQSNTQGRPQGQQQQSTTQGWQQQSRPQGQQQWPGSQQSNTQGRPQGQQQQSTTQGWQQQSRPQGQQQRPGSQQPRTQGRPQREQQQPNTEDWGQESIPRCQQQHERGSHGTKFLLETNYLTLDLKNMPNVAYHYDVKIEFNNTNPKKEPPKKFLRPAFLAYAKEVWPNFALAYDGKASAYSAQKLPEDKLNAKEEALIKVKMEDDRELEFLVTMKLTVDAEVDLNSLRTYQKDRIFDKPMKALQCIEVVLSSPCHEIGVRAGRSFFTRPQNKIDLGDGYELWHGLYQAAMLCDAPLLNVDVSHKSFPSPINLIEFYNKSGRYNSPEEDLQNFLKGLTVIYKPPFAETTPKRYKFNNVLQASSKQMFTNMDGVKMTVANYYAGKNYKLKYPDLPCLHVGSTLKNIYIPLEFIAIPEGQAILRKDNENQIRNMIKNAATSTGNRKQKIMDLLNRFNYYAHPIVERFGVTVGKNFIKVEARFLQSPKMKYSKNTVTLYKPGEWKGQKFFNTGNSTYKWAILNFSTKITKMKLENFVKLVLHGADQLGMKLENKCTSITNSTDRGNTEEANIRKELTKLKDNKINMVFVILPLGKGEQYSKIKQVAEINCGVVTQCIKSNTIYKEDRFGSSEINDMTVNNILLKVNAKLNGINHTIDKDSQIALQKKSNIMFVGADVSHPSPLQKNIPSIVGVVASHDEYGAQYNMQYRLQEPKLETILDMENIFYEHLLVYHSHMGKMPDNIIYYRDGVSDGQFQAIEKVELNAMRAACKMAKSNEKLKIHNKWDPKFTCLIVVKRHHTRFFPKEADGEGRFNNVKAGTVVDTTIIHPGEEQFFMVSHKAIQGTSKPTRYNVIVDDEKIPINDLQTLTYNLCHLFPRCNRSVSYPAPAYLSHLVGLRGRAYIQGKNINLDKLEVEYKNRQISKDMKLNPMYFV